MLSKFLVTRFIKNHENTEDKNVRTAYGYLGSIVGIILNFILFSLKLFIGIVSNSIAVIADAFNNLSDSASSLITLFGFKLSNKPADKDHPFGHGRIEYISALIVSFLVILVGFEFTKTSFQRILNPDKINFNIIIFVLMLVSIVIKIWIGKFNTYLGKTINSKALEASSFDAFADVISSSVVALSLLISNWTTIPIDGYIGVLVALFILYSGYTLVKETINPLLGEAPDPELVKAIQNSLINYEYIQGVHDLIVHNYGPGRCMATIHAEVPCNESLVKIHEIIDRAEKEISEKLDVVLVIHMDPICDDDKEVMKAKEDVIKLLSKFSIIESMHDFRVVGEGEIKNLIFDVVIDIDESFSEEDEKVLIKDINTELKKIHPDYNAVITVDRNFSGV